MAPGPSAARTRTKLTALAQRASACARRFGLRFHVGIGESTERTSLPVRYRGALWAAEKALSRGSTIVYAESEPTPSAKRLRDLKNELARSVGQRSVLLSPRFDRYIETILVHCGYRLEPTRAQLESGAQRLAEPFLATGALDEESLDIYAAMERAAEDAPDRDRARGPLPQARCRHREHAAEPASCGPASPCGALWNSSASTSAIR